MSTRLVVLVWLLAGPLQASEIHQWRDAQGRLHFGDAPPQDRQSENISDRYAIELPFEIHIEGVDHSVSPELHQRLTISVSKIFEIYRQALDIRYAPGQSFDIHLYADRDRFNQYQRRVAPDLENPIGFYNSRSNRITAWAIPDRDALLALITHECSHAVIADYSLFVPIWLNEGLAEYFAQLHVHGLSAEVPVAEHWLRRLRGQQPSRKAFLELLAAPAQQWYATNDAQGSSYALSWSVVWFLMDSREGRALIRQILDLSRERQDHVLDSIALIDSHWPGGSDALYRSWRGWLQRANGRHRY